MDRLFFLFLGYTLIWALIFWYTWRLGHRQRELRTEIEQLKKSLQGKA